MKKKLKGNVSRGVKVRCKYWFEYHCNESLKSPDAPAWLRSHEQVVVVRIVEPGIGRTYDRRVDNGAPRVLRVRWNDGFEWDVFEDELLNSPGGFCRPDPLNV